jgi:Ankyrin repeats (3 copies)
MPVFHEDFALIKACEFGHLEVARELFNVATMNVNVKCSLGFTPLIVATLRGNLEVVKELMNHEKVQVNAANHSRETALTNGKREWSLGSCSHNIEAQQCECKCPKWHRSCGPRFGQ